MNKISDMVKALNYEIPYKVQSELLRSVKEFGDLAPVEGKLTEPFWIGQGFRDCDRSSFANLDSHSTGRLSYLLRLNPQFDWYWVEHPLVETIKSIIKPLEPAIERLNRITTIVQIPGREVPAHRDLIVGDSYKEMRSENETFFGEKELQYKGDPWFAALVNFTTDKELHKKQDYYGLRIPLSDREGDNGRPFIQEKTGLKHYYNVGNKLFLLDEASAAHGADAVDFYRGVVIVDAQLNIELIRKWEFAGSAFESTK